MTDPWRHHKSLKSPWMLNKAQCMRNCGTNKVSSTYSLSPKIFLVDLNIWPHLFDQCRLHCFHPVTKVLISETDTKSKTSLAYPSHTFGGFKCMVMIHSVDFRLRVCFEWYTLIDASNYFEHMEELHWPLINHCTMVWKCFDWILHLLSKPIICSCTCCSWPFSRHLSRWRILTYFPKFPHLYPWLCHSSTSNSHIAMIGS